MASPSGESKAQPQDTTLAGVQVDSASTPQEKKEVKQSFWKRAFSSKTSDEEEKEKEKPALPPVPFHRLFRFSTKWELFLDFVGLIAAAAAGAAEPLMTLLFGNLTQEFVTFGTLVESIQAGADIDPSVIEEAANAFRNGASRNATYLVYIGIGVLVTTHLFMYTWVYTSEVNAKRIRERYLQAILRQDIAFFDNVGAGEVATRIQTDTHLVQTGISEKVALVVHFFASFLTGFILAYARNWRLALALTSIVPCMGISGALMGVAMSKYKELSLKHIASAGTLAEEVISTIRTAQAFGMQKVLAELYNVQAIACQGAELKSAIWAGAGYAVMFFVIYASYGLAFSFGTTLINSGNADPGEVINVFLAIFIGFFSLAMLAPEGQAVTNACAAAAKLYATIDTIPEIDSSNPDGLKPSTVQGTIVFDNVKFRYPSRPSVEVLKGLSITFDAGKTTALVGASGSGKSTIVSLIERFYDPSNWEGGENGEDKGAALLDGNNLRDLNIKWLRTQIGLVSQEPVLFNTTITENVSYGLIGTEFEKASEEEKLRLVQEACVRANADEFVRNLPDGYATQVGERGFLLSGGQKQRIAIARAIISNPKILLLDEATSALDTQSEGVVQDALDKAKVGRTTVVIAHRLSTVKDADLIYVLGEGMLVESGTHNELLEKGGAYKRLVEAQQLRETRSDGQGVGSSGTATPSVLEEGKESRPQHGRRASVSAASVTSSKFNIAKKETKVVDYSLWYLFMRLGKLVPECWWMYGIGMLGAWVSGAIFPVYGIVFSRGIEVFSYTDPAVRRFEGDRVALWFFVMAIVATIAYGIQTYLFSYTAAILCTRLRTLSFKSILRQDIEFFDREDNSTGALTANLSENPQKVNGIAGVTLGTIVQSIATLVIGVIMGMIYLWKVGLVGLACTPLLIGCGWIRLRVLVQRDEHNKVEHESSAQLACESAGSIRTVASLTLEDHCLQRYSQSLEIPLRQSNVSSIWSHFLYAFSQASAFWVIALVFWYGATLVANLEASIFEFFVALMSITFGAMQVGNVFSFVPDMSTAKGASSALVRLMDSMPDIDAESEEGLPVDSEKSQGRIQFKDVHFWYPTRPGARVLRGINLDIKPGTYVALVGASGSGKSTVIQLLERFYDPISGGIYLDGGLVSDFNVQEYRKQIALVSQEPTLYAGTIKFNILLGATKPREEVTQEEIEEACRDANILDFITGLPDGFETQVGAKGMQLSGGQKQRIAIARALLRKPKVLLLDEATSALDSNSEKVVQEALDQAAKGRTTVAIAHRLSTIQNADCIYFIKEGKVSEAGTHDELISRQGDYYSYVQLQGLSKRD
ncbi:hypothetical protein AX16_004289 [Volvariella volvacea WC 439]|nr:hypothetical protein AX16_004289 [Volvariella volvacea WC 439]